MAIRVSESSSGYVKVGERPSRSRIVLQVNKWRSGYEDPSQFIGLRNGLFTT